MTFLQHVKECTKANGGKPLTRAQLLRLREAYEEEKKTAMKESAPEKTENESEPENTAMKENVSEKTFAGSPENAVKENARTRSTGFATILKEASAYKKETTGSAVLTRDEIGRLRDAWALSESSRKRIHEAKQCIIRGRRALREDDMQGAVDATQQAVNTMGQVDPNVVNVDPQIQASIQAVLDATNQLAQQTGLAQGDDLGQQADGSVPPVEGQPADPNAQAATAAPVADPNAMVEAARQRMSNALNEKKVGNGQIGNPSEKELANGKDGGNGASVANVWKPTPIKYSKTGSLNEKSEVMIDKALNEEKLDFKALLKNGFFG